MIQQEVNNDILNRLYNWTVSDIIVEDDGTAAGALVNHTYRADRPDAWSNSTFTNILFVERQAGGKHLNRATQHATKWINPRLVELKTDGTGWIDKGAAPITNA